MFSIEKTPLGTAGAIKKAMDTITEDSFVVMNGDIVTNINLRKILNRPNTIVSNELKTQFFKKVYFMFAINFFFLW